MKNYPQFFIGMQAEVQADTAQIKIQSTDTIIQVVSRTGPRLRPYLWIFSPRTLVQTIQSRNPSNKIIYLQTIKIKK